MTLDHRIEDKPAMVERVVALETNVSSIHDAVTSLGDDLREHIVTEGEVIRDLAVAMQAVVSTTDTNAKTMERMSSSLDKMADHTTRVAALEAWRDKAEPSLDKAKRLWWSAVLVVSAVPSVWALLLHFKVF